MLKRQEQAKPVCGGGNEAGADDYDLPLHIAAVFIVMLASILGAGFPVVARKLPGLHINPKVFFACKHFGTGVLVATAFVHLLPTAFASLTDPCLPDLFTEQYPAMPGVIMMGSMFCLFVIEMYLNAKTGGHSHGGPMGTEFTGGQANHGHGHGHAHAHAHAAPPPRPPRPYEESIDFDMEDEIAMEKKMLQRMYEAQNKTQNPYADGDDPSLSQMPAWFVVFYEQYVRQRMELIEMIKSVRPRLVPAPAYEVKGDVVISEKDIEASSKYIDSNGNAVDEQTYKRMSMNITLLEGGILFHSVFVGMTISITSEGFIILLIAIVFHQMFEGLGLGARIAEVPYAKGSIRPWALVVAFGTTAPIGQAIGLITRTSYDPNSAFGLIIVGVFNAISSGLLIYAALVDLLAEDFLSEEAQLAMKNKDRIQAFSWVLAGAAGMSIVGAFA
ncbi:zinc-regulated transporter 2 [Stachybotrys elegans]|uniref:Zinc-regulated transporter 2 n=1 Tax=Stachybotrys elegans TaxID=80388 RepID=A0A8K0WRC3_9HYPO|nr:zinc-regulated transporter 2 [Stachybotrys elegans]